MNTVNKITYYNCTERQLINALLRWAEKDAPSTFDDAFIQTMSDRLGEFDNLTPRQRAALENIAERFSVDVADYL